MTVALDILVRRAAAGDEPAFVALIHRYERTGLAIALATLGGPAGRAEDAADVVQEAFTRAWQKLPSLANPLRFGSWLCEIVRNLAHDHRRRRRHFEPLDETAYMSPMRIGLPDHRLRRSELRDVIDASLAELDELSRCAVVLRYYEDLDSRQIAELLGTTPAAVDMRLSRARQQLRSKLADHKEEFHECQQITQ